MKTISHEEARRLMDKFLDGATSNAEEGKLQAYFTYGNPAEDLAVYGAMMGWYSELEGSGRRVKSRGSGWLNVRRRWYSAVAAASVIAAIAFATIGRTGWMGGALDAETLAMYEGSYMMRNGKKVTDLSKIIPVILDQEEKIATMRRDAKSEFANAQEAVYRELLENCSSDLQRKMLMSRLKDEENCY